MAPRLATRKRIIAISTCSAAGALICALVLPLVGSSTINLERAWAGVSPDAEILWQIRVPRVLLAMLAGGGLAIAGVLFQALLRNSLAEPYTLGVSSGAALGAVCAISFGWREVAGIAAVQGAALAGAFVTLVIVLGAGSKGRRISPFTLLLAGVTVNSICLAGILFLQNVATLGESIAITRWLMGGIESVPISTLGFVAAGVLPAAVYSFVTSRQWNLIAVGEEWAQVRGVATSRYLLAGYVVSSFLTGAITALTGPIGFVGLIVPHALRFLFGADHRALMPGSFFVGAVFLGICDTVARTALAPAELPVGVITAMLGGPFFIWILRSR
jgi:iron complex transport system permease protein